MKLPSFSFLKHLSYGEHIRPWRDWFALLSAAVFLSAVSLGWNLWLLHRIQEGDILGGEGSVTVFDATPIEIIQEVFQERREEELRFKREYRFVDPSVSGS